MKEVEKHAPKNAIKVLIGNNSQLKHYRVVPKSDAIEYAKSVGAKFLETEKGSNLDKLVFELAEELIYNNSLISKELFFFF